VRNHGSYRTVLLFNVWDKFQSDVLPKQHFCYCLGYDPHKLISGPTEWYFHLWLNTIRIYRERLAVKEELEGKLREVCPKEFQFKIIDRAIEMKINFELNNGLDSLIAFLKPKYISLIEKVHPVLMPVIDRYSVYGERAEIKAEVARRGRLPISQVRVMRPDLLEEYSRSIPPKWRVEVLKAYDYKCAHCGIELQEKSFHMDHKTPFSIGGKRQKSNFQPLCPPCNLKKGNRFVG
jgi:hypothetical protein